MRIISVNLATAQTICFNGSNIETGIFKRPTTDAVQVSQLGLTGDTVIDRSVHGGVDQAVYLYHKEDYDWWSETLGRKVEYGAIGENLTIEGSPADGWTLGDRLLINGLVLEISAPRTPCFKLGVSMGDHLFVKQFVQACRPGAYARVITEGSVKTGDAIVVEKTRQDYATVKDVFDVWHSKTKSLALIEKALNSPLASMHRSRLQMWYEDLA